MVRSDYDHSVNVGPGKEILVIFININFDFLLTLLGVEVFNFFDETVAFYVKDIASCDYADIVHREEKVKQDEYLLTEANEAESNLVIG